MINRDLIFLLDSARDWLKYAEAKNAALIAFCGIFLSVLFDLHDRGGVFRVYLIWVLFWFSTSIFLSFLSFMPHVDAKRKIKNIFRDTIKSDSVIFFGDVANTKIGVYEDKLRDVLGVEHWSRGDLDCIFQIYIICKITNRKMELFKLSLMLLLVGIFGPLSFLVFLVILKNGERESI